MKKLFLISLPMLPILGFVLATWTSGISRAGSVVGASAEGHGEHADAEPNRLAAESSPYLRLHQFNPVDWYPWGDEALEKAKREQKPIFLSVGYATCYWCHVMERESFSDPEIAAFMNQNFVNIKVDREERPDLDEIYMLASQLLSRGRGGWPNSVFMTPQLEPFFGGTYFPPDDRGGRPGFATLLRGLDKAWKDERPQVEAHAQSVAERMRQILSDAGEGSPVSVDISGAAKAGLDALAGRFDAEFGGFSQAPKFPSPSNLFLLLSFPEHPKAREMLALTLDQMARGGVYDQVGGGFHRYATDRAWRVPHFEKMLYDNGSLLEVYALHFERQSPSSDSATQASRLLRQIATFLAREMTSPEGALYSAIDAETDAREGAFYIWRPEELAAVLSAEDYAFAAPILGFEAEPSFLDPHAPEKPPTFILRLPTRLPDFVRAEGLEPMPFKVRLDRIRSQLLMERAKRKRPLTDDKILTDWNGLAIAGLAEAGRVLEDEAMLEQARRAAAFVLENMRPENRPEGRALQHVWREGHARIDAFLADYAYFIHGLLALYEATEEERWREAAVALTEEQIERLWDPQGGGFFVAAEDPDLLARSKDTTDGARPSPNGMALLNLERLHRATGEARYLDFASRSAAAFSAPIATSPAGHMTLARAVARLASGPQASGAQASGAEVAPLGVAGLEAEALSKLRASVERRGSALRVTLKIADGWHVNANPASDEFLVPTRLYSPDTTLEVIYPPGESYAASYAEESILVYSGTLSLEAEIPPAAKTVKLEAQPCDEQRCLPAIILELSP